MDHLASGSEKLQTTPDHSHRKGVFVLLLGLDYSMHMRQMNTTEGYKYAIQFKIDIICMSVL